MEDNKNILVGSLWELAWGIHPSINARFPAICCEGLSQISENIYGSVELNALKLQSKVIDRLELDSELKFIYSVVYEDDYKKFKTTPSETDFLIDTVRLAKESEIALLLKEQSDSSFKGSLRSRTSLDVQKLASSFNGGGHKAASGFSTTLKLDEIINKIKHEIRKQI